MSNWGAKPTNDQSQSVEVAKSEKTTSIGGHLVMFFLMGLLVGSGGMLSYMFMSPDSPLMIRDRFFNETYNDLLELAKKHDALNAEYKALLATK